MCPTREKAIEAQEILSAWLRMRGLRLADEKTHIRHLRDGFNFLAFNIRHYPTPNSSRSGYKLLIKPSPEAIQEVGMVSHKLAELIQQSLQKERYENV